ncbi:MAG: hypothetical protein QNJ05_04470 [Woeseiaceae bacterium]|nr:hypothetical protein [Woeseiaceae bacterium]
MNAHAQSKPEPKTINEMILKEVSTLLFNLGTDDASLLGGLDQWTRRRVVSNIMAKTELVLESANPVEHCYQNLIREIDLEAEMGVLLANDEIGPDSLRQMCEEPGVSGELYHEMERFAPTMFDDEYRHSAGDLDLVWASVQARFDRAQLEADVSEVIMQFFVDSSEAARDMSTAMRSMFYAFHEEGIRRQFDLPSLLDERETHDLFVMVSELLVRAGSYEDRTDSIAARTGAYYIPLS